MNDENIKSNVLKLQNAGATPTDIENFVKLAVQERGNQNSQIPNQIPQDNRDLLQKTGDIVNTFFPGRQIGDVIGTNLIAPLLPGTDTEALKYASQPTAKELAGDVGKVALETIAPQLPVAGSLLGKTAQFGAIGALGGGADVLKAGGTGKEALAGAEKGGLIGAGTGLVFGLAEKGLSGLSTLLGKTGDKIQMSVIKPSQADIKDGFSLETVKKYDLGGSLKTSFEKTDTILDNLGQQLNTKLESSNASIDLNNVYEKTAKRLLGNKLESFGANSQLDNAVEKLKNEIVSVSGNNGLVSIPEAQIIKRASGHFGAWVYGMPTPEATANQKVYNTFYNELKTAIENGSPEGVKDINKEISKLIPVMNALIRRIPVAERNNALSLTDIISLSSAALEPRALSVSLLNLASKSGAVGKILSKTPDLGKALQKVEPVAKSLLTK